MNLKIERFLHFFFLTYSISFRLHLAYNATLPAMIPHLLHRLLTILPWFQELNYSATFVDEDLQVNAAELCSSWNCSSLDTRRGIHHHQLHAIRWKILIYLLVGKVWTSCGIQCIFKKTTTFESEQSRHFHKLIKCFFISAHKCDIRSSANVKFAFPI